MLAVIVPCLFTLVAAAALLSLADSWLTARAVAAELTRERELAQLGFVPQIAAQDTRLRPAQSQVAARFNPPATRPRSLPLRFALQADAAI